MAWIILRCCFWLISIQNNYTFESWFFALSWVDKVTTETESFVSVIANVVSCFAGALDITKFADQVKMRLISQLINDILGVLQKLLKYFNGTIILTFFVLLSAVEPANFYLHLNKALLPGKLSRAPASIKDGSSL